jgi:hypothetical protein
MLRKLAHLLRNERGQILMLAAALATALLGFLGLIIDSGFLYAQRRQSQNASDNAATAAAHILFKGGSEANAKAAALEYAEANGFGDNVIVNIPPASGEHQGEPLYAEVITSEEPQSFFIHVLIPGSSEVRARGVAGTALFPARYALIVLDLDACDAYRQDGGAAVTVEGGGIMVNSSCDESISDAFNQTSESGSLDAESDIDVHGDASCENCEPPPNEFVPWTMDDPLAGLAPPWPQPRSPDSPGTPVRPRTLSITSPGNYVLRPGTYYGGIDINCSNCTVTLESGIYVMAGGGFKKQANPTISGQEVMIYLTDCNGPSDTRVCPGGAAGEGQPGYLAGGGSFALTPPSTGDYYGISFWQDCLITKDFTILGDNHLVQGIFYLPCARLVLGGGASLGGVQLIANTVWLSGNAPIALDYGDFRTFDRPGVTLVE